MQILDSIQSKKILQAFDNIKNHIIVLNESNILDPGLIITESNHSRGLDISVFDHWLSESEAEQEIMFYSQDLIKNEKQFNIYKKYENRFYNYFNELYDCTKIFTMFYNIRSYYKIMQFDSKEEFILYVLRSIREEFFIRLIIPEYQILIDTNYDLTHRVIWNKKNQFGYEKFISIVKNNGLFVLN
jgi:hypothetical protein